MTMLRNLAFALLAVSASACTQETASLGVQSAASSDDSDAGEAGRPPPPALADVVPLGGDGAPQLDGEHVRVPFFLPPPSSADAAAPPPCSLHRASADAPPMPPKDDAPPPKPDAAPPKDAPPGPLALQIAIFASGDAAARPDVVVQCFGKPGEDHVSVPRDMLDSALEGLGAGATARIVLAGFPLPPADKPADADGPPPPPMGRGVYLDAPITDASSLDAPLSRIALPKPAAI